MQFLWYTPYEKYILAKQNFDLIEMPNLQTEGQQAKTQRRFVQELIQSKAGQNSKNNCRSLISLNLVEGDTRRQKLAIDIFYRIKRQRHSCLPNQTNSGFR